MLIPPLKLPPKYTPMGAPGPSLAVDGKGQAFYGLQSKEDGKAYAYRVFWQPLEGEAILKATVPLARNSAGQLESGQGQLQETGGLLVATAYALPGDRRAVSPPTVIEGYVSGGGDDALLAEILGRLATLEQRPAGADPRVTELAEWSVEAGARIAALEQRVGELLRREPSSSSWSYLPAPIVVCKSKLVDGGALLNMAPIFGVPVSAYLVRFCAQAQPNVRVRIGTQAWPYQLTICAQSQWEYHTQGMVFPTEAGDLYVSTVNGPATVWLEVEGYLE